MTGRSTAATMRRVGMIGTGLVLAAATIWALVVVEPEVRNAFTIALLALAAAWWVMYV